MNSAKKQHARRGALRQEEWRFVERTSVSSRGVAFCVKRRGSASKGVAFRRED